MEDTAVKGMNDNLKYRKPFQPFVSVLSIHDWSPELAASLGRICIGTYLLGIVISQFLQG